MRWILLLIPVLLLAACREGPRPIRYGADHCAYCAMTITDDRYGAELVTPTGKVHTFDSVECLAHYEQEGEAEGTRWVTNFRQPGTLIPVEEAFFLRSPNLRSPMGMNLTAFGEGITEDAVLNAFAGHILSWDEVQALVAARQDRPRHDTLVRDDTPSRP